MHTVYDSDPIAKLSPLQERELNEMPPPPPPKDSFLLYENNSNKNTLCGKYLRKALFDVNWRWKGWCCLCERSFPENGSPCEDSTPLPVDNINLKEDIELLRLIEDFGGASWVFYTKKISWSVKSTAEGHHCPRCEAFCTFEKKYGDEFKERLTCVRKGIKNGRKDLEEVSEEKRDGECCAAADLVMTHKFRSMIAAVREFMMESSSQVEVGAVMFIFATARLHGYMLCELLCEFHEFWFQSARSHHHVVVSDGSDAPDCVRPAAFLDGGEASDDLVRRVRERRVRVIVTHSEASLADLPKELQEACGAVIQWDFSWRIGDADLPHFLKRSPVKMRMRKIIPPDDEKVADANPGIIAPPPGLSAPPIGMQRPDDKNGSFIPLRICGSPPGLPEPTCRGAPAKTHDDDLFTQQLKICGPPPSLPKPTCLGAPARSHDDDLFTQQHLTASDSFSVATFLRLNLMTPLPDQSLKNKLPLVDGSEHQFSETRAKEEEEEEEEEEGVDDRRKRLCEFPRAAEAYGKEKGPLSFASLHDIDLGEPQSKGSWPKEFLLFRVKIGNKLSSFAFLTTLHTDEKRSFFGYSLDLGHTVVKLKPQVLNWAEVLKSSQGRSDPEEILKDFNEAMVLKLRPEFYPNPGQALLRHPTSALLVRVFPIDSGGDIFDFEYMKAEIGNFVKVQTDSILQRLTGEGGEVPGDNDTGASSSEDLPCELVPLLLRFLQLTDFEAASWKYGPVYPPLTPLALESVLKMPNMGLTDVPFDKLRVLGRKALDLMAIVVQHCRGRSSFEHWSKLQKDAANWMPPEELARLMLCAFPRQVLSLAVSKCDVNLRATPPGVRGSPSPDLTEENEPTTEDLIRIGEAFLGAYFTSEGGGFLSCWLFLTWLQGKSKKADLPTASPIIREIEASVGHLLFGDHQKFPGKRMKYLEFYERFEEKEQILVVKYAENQHLREYQRANSESRYPQERIVENNGLCEWRPLQWSDSHGTFVMTGVEDDILVPNKVLRWLMRRPVKALVTVRAYSMRDLRSENPPPRYAQLQEKETGELRVLYTEADGGVNNAWFVYERSQSGDLGFEWKEDEGKESRRPLIYSENLKTLFSPTLRKPLPNKIVEAVHHQKNLVMIVTPKISVLKELQRSNELCSTEFASEESGGGDSRKAVRWTFTSSTPTHGAGVADAAGQRSWEFICQIARNNKGLIFWEFDERTRKRQELIYSEDLKTWLSPSLTEALRTDEIWSRGVPIPPKVLVKLRKLLEDLQRECTDWLVAFRNDHFQTPWLPVPYFVKALAPRWVNVGVIEGNILKYSFNNPMLIVEAMTHPTHRETPQSNERLATIGKHLVDALIVQEVVRYSGLSMSSPSVLPDEFAMNQRHINQHCRACDLRTFVVPMRKNGVDDFRAARWPEEEKEASSPLSEEEPSHWINLVNACCNHLMYAYMCCEAEIHKHIMYDSPQLKNAIDEFVKHVKALDGVESQTERWSQLMVRDAPRALSDAFLALAAAIFLDSDWISFCRTMLNMQSSIGKCLSRMVKKVKERPDIPSAEVSVLDPVTHLKILARRQRLTVQVKLLGVSSSDRQDLGTVEEARKAVLQSHDPSDPRDPHRGHTFDAMALLPIGDRFSDPRTQLVHELRDFHCARLWIGGFAVGPFVLAASPRSAARRCALLALRGKDGELQTEEVLRGIHSLLNSNDPDGIQKKKLLDEFHIGNVVRCSGSSAYVGAVVGALEAKDLPTIGSDPLIHGQKMNVYGGIYCDVCERWSNGESQFLEHVSGKSHIKKMERLNGRGQADGNQHAWQ